MATTPNLSLPRRDTPPPREFVALPKVDLHSHSEAAPWLDRVVSERNGIEPHDFGESLQKVRQEMAPSLERLRRLSTELDVQGLEEREALPDVLTDRLEAHMESAANAGAIYLEAKVSGEAPFFPHFAASFREAEARVQSRHGIFFCEAILTFNMNAEPAALIARADEVLNRSEAFTGVDFIPSPYDVEADFELMTDLARRFANAGLGITCHAAEFSTANLQAALRLPGLSRLGHAAFAAEVPGAIDEIVRRGLLVEMCITGNVALGAVENYESHHLRRFLDAGIRVALGSDNPVKIYTTIAHEYWYASVLGLSHQELLQLTANGVASAFTSDERKHHLEQAITQAG